MSVEQMRDAIADVYTGWAWKDKVARMPDDQVMAIYFKFQSSGILDGSKVLKPNGEEKKEAKCVNPFFQKQVGEQLSLFDYL